MEMVEAVVDNNYDVNSHNSSQRVPKSAQNSSTRDVERNFSTTRTENLREPLKAQLWEVETSNINVSVTEDSRQQKIHRQSMIFDDANRHRSRIQLTSLSLLQRQSRVTHRQIG